MSEARGNVIKITAKALLAALVAAATAGLPELVGGERNWDYRFTWVRDGSFSIHALLGLGREAEPAARQRRQGHAGPVDRRREAVRFKDELTRAI